MTSIHHINEERELFRRIARQRPARRRLDDRIPALHQVRYYAQFALLAGALGVVVALGSSALASIG